VLYIGCMIVRFVTYAVVSNQLNYSVVTQSSVKSYIAAK